MPTGDFDKMLEEGPESFRTMKPLRWLTAMNRAGETEEKEALRRASQDYARSARLSPFGPAFIHSERPLPVYEAWRGEVR